MDANWKPIETAPNGKMILVLIPEINRGLNGCEVVMKIDMEDGTFSYWTNGGPNGGDDLHFEKQPSHWMSLPDVS